MKKAMVGLALTVVLGISLTVPLSGSARYSEIFHSVKQTLQLIEANDSEDILVQIEQEVITSKDFKTFQAYVKANQQLHGLDTTLSDQEIMKELILEKLLVMEAEKEGVAVDLAEAKAYAQKMRELLAQQDQEVQDFQRHVIELSGRSEEEYWEEYAPELYRQQLSVMNLLNKLVAEAKLPASSSDSDAVQEAFERYKERLLKERAAHISYFDERFRIPD